MFEAQKPFIKCKEGCAYCCKEGEYTISELEYLNLMFCYNDLSDEIKDKVNENISTLLEKSRERMYECPFLVNNRCSVYAARPLFCRTFGLISYDEKGRKRMPFCVDLNLNYANVYDKTSKTIVKLDNEAIAPVAYNINRKFLRSKKVEKAFNIYFGDDKPLVEWLEDEFKEN